MIEQLKKTLNATDSNGETRKWIVKYDSKDRIKEVKLLHESNTYTGSRTVLSDEDLLDKLINEKEKKK